MAKTLLEYLNSYNNYENSKYYSLTYSVSKKRKSETENDILKLYKWSKTKLVHGAGLFPDSSNTY